MIDAIRCAAVFGSSGAIGSLTGGLIAQEGIKVYFLSRTREGAQSGLKRAISQARSEAISHNIVCGDYAHLLERALKEADLIIESVSEDIAIKREMYGTIDQHRKPDAIIGTTTSSLPLTKLAEERSESFKKHFLSTHFYNPPGKMLACEVASQPDIDPQVYDFVREFLEHKLRRVVVPVKNIPGFAGNRIAFLLFSRITALAEEYGVDMMDYLVGPYTGRLMPPLATIDLVGLDIHKAIIQSLYENTNDEMHDSFRLPPYINKMIDSGILGNKTKGGFYKKLEDGKKLFFDPVACNYAPTIKPHVDFVEKAKQLIRFGRYREAFDAIKIARGREADVVMDILCTYISYSYARIGEVTERELGIDGINKVMSFGFHWAAPSLIVDMLGGKESVIRLLKEKGFEVPDSLKTGGEARWRIPSAGKYFVAR